MTATATAACGQATVTGMRPPSVRPATDARVEVQGTGLTDDLRLVLDGRVTPLRIEEIDPAGKTAAAAFPVPADAIGPVTLWPVTAAGPGPPRTLLVDDLPAVPESGTATTAQPVRAIAVPAAVDGTIAAGTSDRYRIPLAAGDRIAIEVLTRQIGSVMDPVIRLRDPAGRIVATADDGPDGPECLLSHVAADAGDHVLEVWDNAHRGGLSYHLRVGDFPVVSHTLPLAVQRGTTTRVGFGGDDGPAVEPVDVHVPQACAVGGRAVAARLPGGRSSTWVTVLVQDAPQLVEPPADVPLPIPVGISGRLVTRGERDSYRVQGRKGETIRFTTRGRSLGCGTVPRLRLLDGAGKVVAETAVSNVDEPELRFTFAADGDYRLEVGDLAGRGGAKFSYFVSIEPAGAVVAAKAEPRNRLASAVEPGHGAAALDLVVSRAGYDGEITVAIAEPAPGIRLMNAVIPAQATEARIYLAADEAWTARSLAVVRLVAHAGPGPARPVSTTALRKIHDKVDVYPTPAGDGAIVLAGVAGGTARFEIGPVAPVAFVRSGTAQRIPLAIRRGDPAFTGPVTVVGAPAPRGFTVASTMDKDTCVVTLTGSASPGAEPAAVPLLAVSERDGRTAIARIEVPVTWTEAATPSVAPAPPPIDAAPVFAADYAAAVGRLEPRLAGSLAEAGPFRAQGAVTFTGQSFAAFTAGRLEADGPPLGPAWSVSLWFMNTLPVDARPITAYLFSRAADGDAAGGDHLGIGGTFRPEASGRLLIFNGNSRNDVLVGRTPLLPGRWHHVVMVRDGRRVRLYLDGGPQPDIDAELEPTATESGGLFLGARADNFAALRGHLAHAAVFARALTADEALRLHAAARPEPAPRPTVNGDPPPTVRQASAPDAVPPAAMDSGPTAPAPSDAPRPSPPPRAVPSVVEPLRPGLHVFPPRIDLDGARDRQQLAVTTVDATGLPCDRTRDATITIADPAVAALRGTIILPVGDGTTEAVIDTDGVRQTVVVSVRNVAVRRPVQFENEVMVALSKQACSSGACHGSPSGKGGFRLSLRASNRQLDELTLIREELGRRVNPIEPAASLLLRKPLMQVPHGGGRALTSDDEAHAVIRDWITEGARVDPPATPRCERLEVHPSGRQVQRLAAGGRQIVATAHFTDGSRRDVSHLVAYESSAPGIATVDARGWVTPVRRGEVVILVRYLEHIELVPLMFVEDVPGFAWSPPPGHNEVDLLVDRKLRDLQYPPAAVCTDAEFVRRVHLDVVGSLPTVEETEAFLADVDPDKRSRLIDRLLERDDHARFWALTWGDILRMTKKRVGDQGVYKYHRWVEDSFRSNQPHDEFVRGLLLGAGSTHETPAAAFYAATVDADETVETVSQLFLGVRLQCAKCHNHPFDRWSQDDYRGLRAFFDGVRRRATQVPGETFVYTVSGGDSGKPPTDAARRPWLPIVGHVDVPADADAREVFVSWLLAHDNPSFARVEANRIWSQFFARGIVHPVDDFRDSNPPSNPALLDRLAADFVASGFDRRQLMRTILRSRTYQAASAATPFNKDDAIYFSHQQPRLLGAERLLDAIGRVTGVERTFGPLPAGTRATQMPAPDIVAVDFLKVLGQPQRGTVCACERAEDSSLGMAIELFNGRVVNAALSDPSSHFRASLAAGVPVDRVIRDLYLAAVCREPTADEMAAAVARCAAAGDPTRGVEDVCWALLNSDEFVFQH